MRNKSNLFLLLITLLLIIQTPLTAQEKEEPEIPEASITDWVVGICALEGSETLETGNKYLTNSIPLLIYNNLKECKDHNLTDTEKKGYRRKTLKKLVQNEKNALLALLNERDRLLFDIPPADYNTTYETKTEGIDEKKGYITFLENLEIDEMPIKDSTSIVIKPRGEDTLHVLGDNDPLDYMKNTAIDFLICGNIEEIEDYFFIELVCYSQVEQKAVFTLEDAGGMNDLPGIIDRLTKELYPLLLGRNWAGIKVTTTSTASIYLNGILSGIGNAEEALLEPGEVWVDINSTEYENISFPVTLTAGEITEISINLEALERDFFHIDTNPPGADIYVGAVWQGKTPLEIYKPLFTSELMLKREGYLTYHRILNPEKMNKTLNVTLDLDLGGDENPLKMRQDEFYNALGWMAVSVGTTFLMFGISENYGELNKYAGSTQDNNFALMESIFQIGGYINLGITGGLIGFSGYKLYEYIQEAERFIED